MQISKIKSNSLNKSSFRGSDDALQATNKELFDFISSYEPNKRFAKVCQNSSKMLFAIPFIDTFATTMAKNGLLSTKLKAGALTAGVWGSAFLSGTVVSKARKSLNNNSKFFDDLSNNHPVASTFVDLVAMYSLFKGLINSSIKISSFIRNEYPDFSKRFSSKLYNPMKKAINNSFVNKRVVKPLNLLADKHPHFAKNLKLSAKLLTPVILIATLVRFSKESNNRVKQIESNKEVLNSLFVVNNDTKV